MADVYCAEDSQLGRRVALKVLHRRFAADQEFVERFRREASAAAGLQHPNVVQVFDRGELDGTYYIAMEFLEGRTLKQLVREEGPLDPARAIDITIQILRAARFAHKRGIIHRDIKPHNVIVDAEGRVKVTDFGIARAGASDMTETGRDHGHRRSTCRPSRPRATPCRRRRTSTPSGILLYELLTGRVPFDAESAVTIALKQVSETPVAAARRSTRRSRPELEDVVLRALQKDPARRFADADEFIGALEVVRDAPGASGRRPAHRVAHRRLPGARRHPIEEEPRAAGASGSRWSLLLLLLAGGAVAAYLLHATRAADACPTSSGSRADVASQRLINDGFEVEIEQVQSADVDEGDVTRQRPGPDEEVEDGSTVTITVSSGPGEETIPDVLGKPRDVARSCSKGRGFEVDGRGGVLRGRQARPGDRHAAGGRQPARHRLDRDPASSRAGRSRRRCPTSSACRNPRRAPGSRTTGFNPVITTRGVRRRRGRHGDRVRPGRGHASSPGART